MGPDGRRETESATAGKTACGREVETGSFRFVRVGGKRSCWYFAERGASGDFSFSPWDSEDFTAAIRLQRQQGFSPEKVSVTACERFVSSE